MSRENVYNLNCFRSIFFLYVAISYSSCLLPTESGWIIFNYADYIGVLEAAWNHLPHQISPTFYKSLGTAILGIKVVNWLIVFQSLVFIWIALGNVPAFVRIGSAGFFIALETFLSENLTLYPMKIIYLPMIILSISNSANLYGFRDLWGGGKDTLADDDFSLLALSWILPICFLNSVLSKLYSSGFGWIDGSVLRGYFYLSYLQTDSSGAFLLAGSKPLSAFLSISTLAFEAFFSLVFWGGLAKRIILMVAMLFHISVLWIFHLNFFWMFTVMYFIYIDFYSLRKLVRPPQQENLHASAS